MYKVNFKNILVYILLKYLLFYIFLMFKNNDFRLLKVNNLKSGEDWFYYLWLILFMPILNILLFSLPLYLILKVRNCIYFTFFLALILAADFFLYTYLVSQTDVIKGLYNCIISLLLFLIFFLKVIRIKFNIGLQNK